MPELRLRFAMRDIQDAHLPVAEEIRTQVWDKAGSTLNYPCVISPTVTSGLPTVTNISRSSEL